MREAEKGMGKEEKKIGGRELQDVSAAEQCGLVEWKEWGRTERKHSLTAKSSITQDMEMYICTAVSPTTHTQGHILLFSCIHCKKKKI